jgi:hypothetical protein
MDLSLVISYSMTRESSEEYFVEINVKEIKYKRES